MKFLKSWISFALKNRIYVLFLTAIILTAGVISYKNTPIIAFPDLTGTRVVLITQWSGRSAQEVERFVSIPIELEMNSVPKKTYIRSVSLFGLSVLTVVFADEVKDEEARQYIIAKLLNVDLPNGVKTDMLPPQGPTDEVFRYTVHSDTRSIREVKTLQDWVIERQLKSVPGVADIVSFGGEVKIYEVSVDPVTLSKFGITALDVYQALSNSNVNVGGDVIVKNDQAFVVRGLGLLENTHEIENVLIQNVKGRPLYVRNVAVVQESSSPILGQVGRDSLNNVVEGIVILRRGEDPGPVLANVRAKIAELNESVLPSDVQINTFYDRQNLINFTIHTVTKNLSEGVILVCIIVFLFLADIRATLIAAHTIPFALLFAFICLRIKGMSANLLSMGAIDFGMIVDGTVVMIEGLFIVLDKKAQEMGMERFNKMSKLGLIRQEAGRLSRSVFFQAIILITALLPIFAFEGVEGKMFSPLAYTISFAMLGSVIASLTIVPVMVSMFLSKNVVEKHTFATRGIHHIIDFTFRWCVAHKKISYIASGAVFVLSMYLASTLGTEFLPHLNEGSIYVRASLPYSTSLQQSVNIGSRLRSIMRSYPEVKGVVSQSGRPNDGTDPTGFFNIEFHIDLLPKEEWKRNISKEELVAEMEHDFEKFQGIKFGFSQPIMDNVEEAVSGVKGSIAVKIFGDDPIVMEKQAEKVYGILNKIRGIEDLAIIRLRGQPEIRINLDLEKMALYGVTTSDAQSVIEMAIGGKSATEIFEAERKFELRLRYDKAYRDSEQAIGDLYVPTINGGRIPLKLVASIKRETGMSFVYRENNKRYIAVKFSVRGRDMGGTVQEARKKVDKVVRLDQGQKMEWNGEFENQTRATLRLQQVVPVSLVLILLLLFVAFGNMRDALLVFLNVPVALMGGVLALHLTGTNFSIAAGIGFICLFGISVQAGVILISIFNYNLQDGMNLQNAVIEGTLRRVRPVFMTAMMAIIGLLPAAMSTGIGSETQKPLAIVVIGGLFADMILSIHIFPLIVEYIYRRYRKIT